MRGASTPFPTLTHERKALIHKESARRREVPAKTRIGTHLTQSRERVVSKSGWLLLPPEDVPERWRGRGQPMVLVPLLPTETAGLLEEGTATPVADPEQERLMSLVGAGLPIAAIAREMGLNERTVRRHIARLRERFGVASKSELGALLSRHGLAR